MHALPFGLRLVIALLKLSLLGIELAVLAALCLYNYYGRDLPDPESMGQYRLSQTTRVYARDGETLLLELVDPHGGRRTIVPFSAIPQSLKDATIAVEDANFYQNPGIDLYAIARALTQNASAGEVVSGASTITQQLVRGVLLPPEEQNRQGFERKLREAILAIRVSREYSKDQILDLYLNQVYYGNQVYGVDAAAHTYFGKSVSQLTPAEATLIAGLPQSPSRYNPFENMRAALARRAVTLDAMVRNGYLTPQQRAAIDAETLHLATPQRAAVAPHFANYVRAQLEARYGATQLYENGLTVVTTLDPYWQGVAEAEVRRRVRDGAPEEGYGPLTARHATNAGAVMIAPDGQILAMVGSVDYDDPSIDGQVNVTTSPRQPGSALKPIVYAAALQRGWTPATIIWDTPVEYPSGDGSVYRPLNYDERFHGPLRLRMALANSLNIPAIRTIEFVGVQPFVDLAHQMGIGTLEDPAQYGLPLALGAGEVTLLDLTGVYNTFRNGGHRRQPLAILRVSDSRGKVLERAETAQGPQVLGVNGEQIAYLVTDILSDNRAREFMFGPRNVMVLPDDRPAAVKTGTSNAWRDSWAVGYTPDITIGVWVGNSDNTPMQEVAGSNGAGTIWRGLMTKYHAGRPVRGFERPPQIEDATICAINGGLADAGCPTPLPERFVAGSAPKSSGLLVTTIRVGGGGSCLATPQTPIGEVREVAFSIFPPEFAATARAAGVPQPPTAACLPPPVSPLAGNTAQAAIGFPAESAVITGTTVLVRGTALGSYTLEIGAGSNPQSWQPIGRGSDLADGLLGMWTVNIPPGPATIRLRVTAYDGRVYEVRRAIAVLRAS